MSHYTFGSNGGLGCPGCGLAALGQEDTLTAGEFYREHPALVIVHSLLSTAGMVAGAYHGYKRNESVGWAIGWALLGSMFPYITIPVSLAQGFGKPAR
jgi:hypothetical protein